MLQTQQKKYFFIISFILTIFLFIGCEETTPDKEGLRGRVVGSVHGVVTDANTNSRLEGITVTTIVDGEILTATTDSLGYYVLNNLSSGEFELTFSGESTYAVGRIIVNIPLIQQIAGSLEWPDEDFQENFFYSKNADTHLYGLSADLTGTIYTVEDSENTTLASGVTLIADFSAYDISPDKYTATSNSQGIFSFVNLPATSSVVLRSLPFNDGTSDYGVLATSISLIPGGTASSANLFLNIAPDAPFIVQNNYENDNFGITDDLSLTFSKLMQTSSFDISLSGINGNVEFEATWSDDITLTIAPYVDALQANGNYSLSLSGYSQDNNPFYGSYSFWTQEGIQFVYSNLELVDGMFEHFNISENIEITFTMEVELDNYRGYVNLIDESSAIVSTIESLSGDSKTLIIDPLYNLEPNQVYTLTYRVYSAIEGDYESGSFAFETAGEITSPGQVTGFAIDMADNWLADWNTNWISFRWDAVENATSYSIYANDNGNNTDLIRVGSFSAQDFMANQSGTVFLNGYSQFDLYDDDGTQTPFSGGTELMFKIIANNSAGEGEFSSAVVISDETAPTGNLSQSGSAFNNSSTEPRIFTVYFSSGEYLDTTLPTYSIIENGGDTGYVLPSSAVSFEWDSDMKGGSYTVIVPANSNGSGDLFFINGFMDNSGNAGESSISIILF